MRLYTSVMVFLIGAIVGSFLELYYPLSKKYPEVRTDKQKYIMVEYEEGFMIYIQGFHSKNIKCTEGFTCTMPEPPYEIYLMMEKK